MVVETMEKGKKTQFEWHSSNDKGGISCSLFCTFFDEIFNCPTFVTHSRRTVLASTLNAWFAVPGIQFSVSRGFVAYRQGGCCRWGSAFRHQWAGRRARTRHEGRHVNGYGERRGHMMCSLRRDPHLGPGFGGSLGNTC